MADKFPKLREDLKITRQVQQGETLFVVKDPETREYCSFSDVEMKLLRLMDGRRSAKEMASIFSERNPEYELDENDMSEFIASADKLNLLVKTAQERNVMLLERMRQERKSKLLSKKGSWMYKRFPIIDPHKFFTSIHPYTKWIFTWGFISVTFSMMVVAWIIVGMNFEEVLNGVISIYTFSAGAWWQYLTLWAIVLVVIGIHECGHGLTCHHYGGEVHEMGFLLLFFQPCLYANVSDAWTFPKKSDKLWVVFAGGYIEFVLGAIFTFIWALTYPGTLLNLISFQAMTVCGLSSVLFNFNPLIKLDGYYALCDYTEVPNLRQNSLDYVKYLVKTKVFGMQMEPMTVNHRLHRIYITYGVACTLYLMSMMTGIAVMLFNILWGAAKGFFGGILGFVALYFILKLIYSIVGRYPMGAYKFLRDYVKERQKMFKSPKFYVPALVLFLAISGYVVFGTKERTITSTFMLEPTQVISVRTKVDGIASLRIPADEFLGIVAGKVHEGMRVEEGDVVMFVRNDRIQELLAKTRSALIRAEEGIRSVSPGSDSAISAPLELEAARLAYEQAEESYDAQFVRATASGRLIATELVEGEHVSVNQELWQIVDPTSLQANVTLMERDFADVQQYLSVFGETGAQVSMSLPGEEDEFRGLVSSVTQAATREANQKVFQARCTFLPSEEGDYNLEFLRTGMSGKATIHIGEMSVRESIVRWAQGTFKGIF
ncbi:MAG: HlyD family efflux transporter periplasmic adaptor subunit [Planctomycetes bacterium]|nr:HlyD family efflux transporter periplasmic adaptor subunit [Planctomycetota bacterium]